MNIKSVAVIGDGGHAKSCRALLPPSIEEMWTIPDSRKISDDELMWLARQVDAFVLGIGQIYTPKPRQEAVRRVHLAGGRFMDLVAETAFISPFTVIGRAPFIGHFVSVNENAKIGDFAILNTRSVIEHDAAIGDFCHISTGAIINGGARIGNNVFIGSNAVILQQIDICSDVLVGAGSVVVNPITVSGIYVGNPARKIKELPTC